MRAAVILIISIAVAYGLFVASVNLIVLFWRNLTPTPAWQPQLVALGIALLGLWACIVLLRRVWRSRPV